MVETGKKLSTIFYLIVARNMEYEESVYINHRKAQMENMVLYLKAKLERMETELANCI
ncbi:MAG: hypothetical protein PHU66_04955 [Bacteroidaceae bacterium]|nr:hypothetical protein [Bacteroidaceae bacterium]